MTDEIADLDERIRLLRAASRSSEPLEVPARYEEGGRGRVLVAVAHPSAQGHVLSALAQLEKRRALLQAPGAITVAPAPQPPGGTLTMKRGEREVSIAVEPGESDASVAARLTAAWGRDPEPAPEPREWKRETLGRPVSLAITAPITPAVPVTMENLLATGAALAAMPDVASDEEIAEALRYVASEQEGREAERVALGERLRRAADEISRKGR